MKNVKIRNKARAKTVFLWELAKAMGKSEATVTRMLRSELPKEKQAEIFALIDKIAEQKAKEDCE